jgi:hypothetical protein
MVSMGVLGSWATPGFSGNGRRPPGGGDLFFVAVAHGQQHVLGEVQVAALLAVVFEVVGLDDAVHRAAFFAETAEDALGQVDVVARGAAAAVGAHLAFDGDGHGRADGFAQLAGDAALFAVFIAPQRMQAAEARAQRRLFFRELDRDVLGQEVAARQRHALEQLGEHEAGDDVLDGSEGGHGWSSFHFQMLNGDWIHRPTTTSQTSVMGMKIFQPRRMIWS